jgi:hypothetical protein
MGEPTHQPHHQELERGAHSADLQSFDATEILKIKIPHREVEDCVAWHYEKSGLFTVRSAYKLAMCLKETGPQSSTSGASMDDRSIWDAIWKAGVPAKIKIFAWRVATNTLATKVNKCKRTLATTNTCDVCGNAEENEYHAVVACTKSRALRQAMRAHWRLPKEKDFWYTGEDWLQGLLNACSDDERNKTLLLLWRAWYLRDDIVHGKGKESIVRSVSFLLRYEQEVYKSKDKKEIAMNNQN